VSITKPDDGTQIRQAQAQRNGTKDKNKRTCIAKTKKTNRKLAEEPQTNVSNYMTLKMTIVMIV
jgi:hypothetical protein